MRSGVDAKHVMFAAGIAGNRGQATHGCLFLQLKESYPFRWKISFSIVITPVEPMVPVGYHLAPHRFRSVHATRNLPFPKGVAVSQPVTGRCLGSVSLYRFRSVRTVCTNRLKGVTGCITLELMETKAPTLTCLVSCYAFLPAA